MCRMNRASRSGDHRAARHDRQLLVVAGLSCSTAVPGSPLSPGARRLRDDRPDLADLVVDGGVPREPISVVLAEIRKTHPELADQVAAGETAEKPARSPASTNSPTGRSCASPPTPTR